MAFNKELPEWKAAGIEPPLTKRNEGWKPGEKPPADWLNWTQNRTYEALKELQEKSAEITSIQSLSVKSDVRVGTTENITLSGTQTINGIAVTAEDRILVKNQNTDSQNGIYVVKAGAWARAADADTSAKLANGVEVFVREGTVGRQTLWRMTNTGTVILGSTALTFQQTEAPLVSPALTGVPTAPTATAGSNNAQIATTAYVDSVVSTSPAATPLNLGYGHQIVTVPRNTPYNLLNITGRTLINLLGRDGNCEDISKWTAEASTLALDTANAIYGSNALKITVSGSTYGAFRKEVIPSIDTTKYYLLAGFIRNGTGTNVKLTLFPTGGTGSSETTSQLITDTSKMNFVWTGIQPSSFGTGTTSARVSAIVTGGAGATGFFDGIRLYNITQAEYNALAGMTAAQIAAKYPYVDDMKSIVNPYVIKQGENLLPPFSEWNLASTVTVTKPYRLEQTATANYQASNVIVDAMEGVSYTLSGTFTHPQLYMEFLDLNKVNIGAPSFYYVPSSGSNISVIAPTGTKFIKVSTNNPTTGSFYTDNLMLNIGSTALPFKPKADDYLFFPNVQLASNMDNTIFDTLYKRDGKYWKLSRIKWMDLDGSLTWLYDSDQSGFKTVKFTSSGNMISSNGGVISHNTVKYDGKPLQTTIFGTGAGVQGAMDRSYIDGSVSNIVYLSIADTDSGWGESYTPSTEEIRAYFNGWKMSSTNTASPAPYTGSGNKYWYTIGAVPLDSQWYTDITYASNPTNRPPSVKPYKLQYQLVTPTVEEIAVEGDITLHEGLNHIEVGNGMIVRERADLYWSTGNTAQINRIAPGSPLKNRVAKKFAIYKNGMLDAKWSTISADVSNYGNDRYYTNWGDYDLSASYTVTYLALDQYSLTSNVQSIQGVYASNLKTVVDMLADNQADVTTRVGVLENTKAEKEKIQWITPTLLNGWVNVGSFFATASYYKANGFVRLRGAIKSGTASTNVPIFVLPQGYRPSSRELFAVYSGDGTVIGTAQVFDDGRVMFISGNNMSFSLSNISFLAEQ
ncbi:hypothetical protein [Paenibacillus periandrae]|uniref:hypothetical protein n=1 Tax=Paenibacillus periandrae TaxID=1761741 RepID=UPI001F09818F|nr:hypothetical protein [Paenibacillus periandrae]